MLEIHKICKIKRLMINSCYTVLQAVVILLKYSQLTYAIQTQHVINTNILNTKTLEYHLKSYQAIYLKICMLGVLVSLRKNMEYTHDYSQFSKNS